MRAPASTKMMRVRKGRDDEAAREAPLTTRSWGRLTEPASVRPWVLVEPLAWAVRRVVIGRVTRAVAVALINVPSLCRSWTGVDGRWCSGIVGRLGRSAGVWSGWAA